MSENLTFRLLLLVRSMRFRSAISSVVRRWSMYVSLYTLLGKTPALAWCLLVPLEEKFLSISLTLAVERRDLDVSWNSGELKSPVESAVVFWSDVRENPDLCIDFYHNSKRLRGRYKLHCSNWKTYKFVHWARLHIPYGTKRFLRKRGLIFCFQDPFWNSWVL